MAFLNARLLDCVAYGFEGRRSFATRVHPLRSGHESRNASRAFGRWAFAALAQNISPDDYAEILAAFDVVRGSNDSFRLKNWLDYQVTGQSLGNAPSGSTPVQLVKSATFGGTTRTRIITKPVGSTVIVYQNGVAKAGTIADTTGLFTPTTAWTDGQPITAEFDFATAVRFMADELPASYDNWRAINVPVELIEVFGE
jgi:uncharacterized protein (TIGR02217 family)